jgi:hypothetical protein
MICYNASAAMRLRSRILLEEFLQRYCDEENIGDFSEILYSHEKEGGNLRPERFMGDFRDAIKGGNTMKRKAREFVKGPTRA